MLHACVVRFDVTENLEKFLGFWSEHTRAEDRQPGARHGNVADVDWKAIH